MILLMLIGLFLSAPLVPSNETPRCVIVNAAMEQVRPCRPCELERWAC